MYSNGLCFIAFVLACSVPACRAAPSLEVLCVRRMKCDVQPFLGCYFADGICRCAQAWCCENPFNYSSMKSCRDDNTVTLGDPCEDAPCKNNGYCVQIRGSAAYRCDCQRTGYFGPRCHEKCPKDTVKEFYKLMRSKAEFARQRLLDMLACRQ